MPYSSPIFDNELELYFREVVTASVLDIGAGEGKYGEMLRRVQPKHEANRRGARRGLRLKSTSSEIFTMKSGVGTPRIS